MAATYRQFPLRLNTDSDADVIAYLESRANKNDTIRQALRKQMKRELVRFDDGFE